jgi:hypothetical protein
VVALICLCPLVGKVKDVLVVVTKCFVFRVGLGGQVQKMGGGAAVEQRRNEDSGLLVLHV